MHLSFDVGFGWTACVFTSPVILSYFIFFMLLLTSYLGGWVGGWGAVWVLRLTLTCSTVRFYDSYQFTFLWAIIVMTVKFRHSFSYRKDTKQKVALWPMKIISFRLNDFTVVWDWVFSLLLDKWKKLHLKPRDPFVFTDLAIQLESSRFSQPAESRPRSMRHSHQNLGNLQMQSLFLTDNQHSCGVWILYPQPLSPPSPPTPANC